MALKEVVTTANYLKWGVDIPVDGVVKGFYKELKESNRKGWDPNVYIESVDGQNVWGLGGKRSLLNALKDIRLGWYVEITYKGKIILDSGENKGSECHQFIVKYDDERIHPLFSGDTTVRQEVAYKAADAEPVAGGAPALVKPEASPAPVAPSAPEQAPAAAGPATPKRSIFS